MKVSHALLVSSSFLPPIPRKDFQFSVHMDGKFKRQAVLFLWFIKLTPQGRRTLRALKCIRRQILVAFVKLCGQQKSLPCIRIRANLLSSASRIVNMLGWGSETSTLHYTLLVYSVPFVQSVHAARDSTQLSTDGFPHFRSIQILIEFQAESHKIRSRHQR